MYIERSTVTIGATAIQVSSLLTDPTLFRCAKLTIQTQSGSTGSVYIGPATVSSSGANAYKTLVPPATGQLLPEFKEEDQRNQNSIDTRAYWVHGSNPGDKVSVVVEHN